MSSILEIIEKVPKELKLVRKCNRDLRTTCKRHKYMSHL